MILIKRIDITHELYPLEQELRNEVLLRPIGIPDHAWEMHDQSAWHFVALADEQLVGCVVLRPLDQQVARVQLMQMAVSEQFQGQGIGKQLVHQLLGFCAEEGIREVVCHARENAINFYSKLGFEIYGEPFEEVGVLHRHMRFNVT
ncbi:MAG: GNAT family N-acetyltransferase [Flammeovirgaceae bacterium]